MSWITAALALVLSGPANGPERVYVGAGRDFPLPPGVRAFAVRPEIEDCPAIRLQVQDPRRLFVWGDRGGTSELILFGATGPVSTVAFKALGSMPCGICGLCKELPPGYTVQLASREDLIYLVGMYGSVEEALAAQDVARRSRIVILAARLNPRVVRRLLLEASHELWRAGYLDHRVTLDGARTVISGPPLAPDEKQRLDALTMPVRARLEQALAVEAAVPKELFDYFVPCPAEGYWNGRNAPKPGH